MTRPETATVTIHSLQKALTRQGFMRYTMSAERVDDLDRLTHWLSLTTLDEWRASLCDIARQKGTPLRITFRDTGYFDKDIVSIEQVEDEQVSA